MINLIPDHPAKLYINLLLIFSVTDATEIEVWTITNITLVIFRPTDEAVILISSFHEVNKSLFLGLRNGLLHLAFLVSQCICALLTTQGSQFLTNHDA